MAVRFLGSGEEGGQLCKSQEKIQTKQNAIKKIQTSASQKYRSSKTRIIYIFLVHKTAISTTQVRAY